MKVETSPRKQIAFWMISSGGAFYYTGILFLKLKEDGKAVVVEDGDVWDFTDDSLVVSVNAKVVV